MFRHSWPLVMRSTEVTGLISSLTLSGVNPDKTRDIRRLTPAFLAL